MSENFSLEDNEFDMSIYFRNVEALYPFGLTVPYGWRYTETILARDRSELTLFSPFGHRIIAQINCSLKDSMFIDVDDKHFFQSDAGVVFMNLISTYAHRVAMFAWHGIRLPFV